MKVCMNHRMVFVCFWMMLTACSTKPKVEPENPIELVKPDVPKVTTADKAGDIDTLSMQYAAAGITVAKEQALAGRVEVAAKEIDLALANLVRPTSTQLESARNRAAKNDDAVYKSTVKKAEALQKKSDEAWSAFEREKGKNDLLEKQLIARQKEIDAKAQQERLDAVATKCTWLGGLLVVVGVLSFALGTYLPLNKMTAPICIAVGSGIIALPLVLSQLLEWPWLSPVIMGTVVVILVAFTWHWFKTHRSCRA